MKVYFFLGLFIFILFVVIAVLCRLIKNSCEENAAMSKEIEKLKVELQEEKKRYEINNKIKEQMETGDSKRDFDNSINILRNLKK